MKTAKNHLNGTREKDIENYYRYHSRIYDATRWSFLFGRETILDMIPNMSSQPRILEIGCGTGKNIKYLEYHFPEAQIVGVDLSKEMLNVAQNKLASSSQKVKLINLRYGSQPVDEEPFDLILLSYSLTMIGGQIEEVLKQINADLKSNSYIAVVDFHTTPLKWFRIWMRLNHVNLSGHILPLLEEFFHPAKIEINKAYGGIWSYFLFLGRK